MLFRGHLEVMAGDMESSKQLLARSFLDMTCVKTESSMWTFHSWRASAWQDAPHPLRDGGEEQHLPVPEWELGVAAGVAALLLAFTFMSVK
jgi:hypothetical protein